MQHTMHFHQGMRAEDAIENHKPNNRLPLSPKSNQKAKNFNLTGRGRRWALVYSVTDVEAVLSRQHDSASKTSVLFRLHREMAVGYLQGC